MNKTAKEYIRKFKYNSIYFKLFISCISLVIVPVVLVGSFIYQKVSTNFQHEINKYSLNSLQYMEKEINKILNDINSITYQYAANSDIRFFIENSFDSDRLVLKRLYDDLNDCLVSNDYIDSIYIFFKPFNQLITSFGISNMNEYYDLEWYSLAKNENENPVLLSTRKVAANKFAVSSEKNVVTIVRFLSLGGESDKGAIAININIDSIQRKISEIGRQDDSLVFIIDNRGFIIASNDSKYMYGNLINIIPKNINELMGAGYFVEEYEGEKIISYTNASCYGWRFIQLTPIERVTKNIMFIKNLFLIVLGITFIASILIVYFITNRIYTPFVDLISILHKEKDEDFQEFEDTVYKDEMDELRRGLIGISDSVEEEKRENFILRKQVEHTKSIVVKKYFQDLMLGSGVDYKKAIERLKMLGWSENSYIILIITIDNFYEFQKKWGKDDQALWKFCLVNITEELINRSYQSVVFENLPNEFITVINVPDKGKNKALTRVAEMSDEIRESVIQYIKVFSVTVCIGSISNNIAEISQSYKDALDTLQMRWLKGKNTTLCFSKYDNRIQSLFYNVEKEKQIITALKENELDQANTCFEQFVRELVEKNNSVYENVYQGVLQLVVSILRMLHQMGYDYREVIKPGSDMAGYNILHELRKVETLADVKNWMREKFKNISDFIWERRNTKTGARIKNVIAYINEHYDKDIYLLSIAERFGMHESHLSRAFRQETGENFIEYFHKVRIARAKSLIEQTDMNINDIYKAVGYFNIQTFIRNFKKFEGVTPGQYREDIKALKDCSHESTK